MTGPVQVRLRRVYDKPEPADGRRVLVDRLWPRGLSKDRAALDDWLRAVAPSDELRLGSALDWIAAALPQQNAAAASLLATRLRRGEIDELIEQTVRRTWITPKSHDTRERIQKRVEGTGVATEKPADQIGVARAIATGR